jgi:GTP-binding protein
MKIKTAEFVISNSDYKKCPESSMAEYAFIGRSNVGKSSLINMITGNSKLAKTSSRPGKTQLINHFLINKKWYLVDLPGYGWAKVSKDLKEQWGKMIKQYLIHRENLYNVFVLIDSRIPPQKIDLEFINWLGENQVPLSVIFTKADKVHSPKTATNINDFKTALSENWEELPEFFITSATKKMGDKEITNYISNINT